MCCHKIRLGHLKINLFICLLLCASSQRRSSPAQDHTQAFCDYLLITSCIYFLWSGLSKLFVILSCERRRWGISFCPTNQKAYTHLTPFLLPSSYKAKGKESPSPLKDQPPTWALTSVSAFLKYFLQCTPCLLPFFLLSWHISISIKSWFNSFHLKKILHPLG